jgi:membrane protein
MILYFGGEFTRAYALNKGARITPNEYAQWDKDAVVAGAKPQDSKQEKVPQDQFPRPAIPIAFANDPVMPMKKRKSSGVATVLIGLILYLFRSPRRQEA